MSSGPLCSISNLARGAEQERAIWTFWFMHGWHCCHKPVFTSYFFLLRWESTIYQKLLKCYTTRILIVSDHQHISNNCRCASPICDYLLYRCWTRGLVFELHPWGLHVLTRALRTLARSSAFPMKEYAHALCYQQTHSLHLKMLLDPHNWQHLPRFPQCPHLYFRSPYLTIFQMTSNYYRVTVELSTRVMWRLAMSRIGSLGSGWRAWHFAYILEL